MIKGNNYNSIMEEHKAKNKLKGSDIKVDVVYEVFKDTGKFVSTIIHRYCSKTACDIACYISETMLPSQTSIKFNSRNIADSPICRTKDPKTINAAIKELINVGAIIKWRDIEGLPETVEASRDWYLLNPCMIKAIGCEGFKEQANTTIKQINNSTHYVVNEYSAIVYNFKNKNKRRDN